MLAAEFACAPSEEWNGPEGWTRIAYSQQGAAACCDDPSSYLARPHHAGDCAPCPPGRPPSSETPRSSPLHSPDVFTGGHRTPCLLEAEGVGLVVGDKVEAEVGVVQQLMDAHGPFHVIVGDGGEGAPPCSRLQRSSSSSQQTRAWHGGELLY